MRKQAEDALERVETLQATNHAQERERGLEKAAATFRERALEGRIAVCEQDAYAAADRIAALEVENQRLRDRATSFGPARELWTYAEA